MQVNNANLQTNFKSKFVPNFVLGQAFDRAAKEQDRFFVKAVKAILNDGKDDTLELSKRTQCHMNLYVNGEITEEGYTFLNYYGNVGIELIKKYAAKLTSFGKNSGKFNILSEKEKELVKEDVNLIKLLSENFENGTNYIDDVQKVLENIKQKLDNNTRTEVMELKDIVFNK